MHKAYKDDKELCKWLRENSSGDYRLSAYAAERIETLTVHLDNVQKECDRLEAMEKAAPDMLELLTDIYKNHDAGFYIDTRIAKLLSEIKGESK